MEMALVLKALKWKMGKDLKCERESGGKVSLTEGEDKLSDHILRADLRKAITRRTTPIREKEEFSGIIEHGIDYEATTKIARERYGKSKAKEKQGYVKNRPEIEDILIDCKTQKNMDVTRTG